MILIGFVVFRTFATDGKGRSGREEGNEACRFGVMRVEAMLVGGVPVRGEETTGREKDMVAILHSQRKARDKEKVENFWG